MKGSVATLLDPPAALGPAEMHQFFRIIDAEIDRMHLLISDLLDVARIETGTLAVSPEPTDLAALTDGATDAFHSGGGSHHVDVDVAAGLPWVMADRTRIVQVLAGLLANAARNSPASSPIRVSATLEDVHVAVSVTDQGPGVPAESPPHLFRRFSRTDGESQAGDTGLSLAICKGIVEAHGGRVRADSNEPGPGARLTITLPTAEQTEPASPPTAPARSGRRQAGRRARVLAVDDDPQALRYLREALQASGYAPTVTADPQEALRLLHQQRPHPSSCSTSTSRKPTGSN